MNMLNLDISAVRSESLARLNQLRISYVVQLQRRLATFWTWWLGELVPLLPADLRAAMAKRDQGDFVSLEADTLVVRRGTISDSRTLVRIPLKAPRSSNPNLPGDRNLRMLLLDAEDVLTRTFTLPLAAEENLREVLSFEIPRKTPFSADQVYYDFVVGSRDAKTRTLVVELVLAPRRVIDRSLEELVGLAIDVDSVSVLRADGLRAMPVNLLPRKQRTRVADSIVNRLQAAMAVIALLLLVTAVAFPIVRKQQVLQSLEPQLKEAVRQAKDSNRLRQQVETLVLGSGFLLTKKQTEPSVLGILDELTRTLPDHTWISRLDISTSKVALQGQSSSSASLISTLEASPVFEHVSFQSPVTQISNGGEERFHIAADIAGGGRGE